MCVRDVHVTVCVQVEFVSVRLCPAIFPMQICLPPSVFSSHRVIPPCISFTLPTLCPLSFYCRWLPSFHPVSLLTPSSSSRFLYPLLHLLLWSDHRVKPYQKELYKGPQLVPRSVSLCVCVPLNKAYLSLTDLRARESNLSELTGCSNNIHFRNIWLQAAVVLQVERKCNFCSVEWDSAEIFWN